jgi:hypothetical protein
MSQIRQRYALGDAPMQQRVDSRHLALVERPGIGLSPELMRKPRDKEHQFSRFVARLRGAVTEIHPGGTQRPRASLYGGTDALGPAIVGGANAFDSCVG